MMTADRRMRPRVITGPEPYSYGLIEKPREYNYNKLGKAIDARIREDQELREQEEKNRQYKYLDNRYKFLARADKRAREKLIHNRIDEIFKIKEQEIEAKRDRLRALLNEEQQMYVKELVKREDTPLEVQARMRSRAKQLRQERESERLAFVHDKLDQQFREQCEELRTAMTRAQRQDIAEDQKHQMKMKAEADKKRKEEDLLFEALRQQSDEAAAHKDAEIECQRQEANYETAAVQREQIAEIEQKRREELVLKVEEKELLKEQQRLDNLATMKEEEEKNRRRVEMKAMYENSLKERLEKRARDEQEELRFDRQLLEEMLKESKLDEQNAALRKRELRDEDRRYREYLKRLKAEEAKRKLEVDKFCDEEMAKANLKQLNRWREEKKAREKLLQEVLCHQREQIKEKIRRNQLKQFDRIKEREELERKLEENRMLDHQEKRAADRKRQNYAVDLKSQMRYNVRQRDLAKQEERDMWEAQEIARQEQSYKIKLALANPRPQSLHPVARELLNSGNGRRPCTGFEPRKKGGEAFVI